MRYACNQELINFAEHIVKQVQRLGLYCNTDDPANGKRTVCLPRSIAGGRAMD
ncbi:predicted protein [Neisseria gonorrhoeae SK-92-679]|nr:predicted protein [Neisseria gonorrhoeae SK-92-679]